MNPSLLLLLGTSLVYASRQTAHDPDEYSSSVLDDSVDDSTEGSDKDSQLSLSSIHGTSQQSIDGSDVASFANDSEVSMNPSLMTIANPFGNIPPGVDQRGPLGIGRLSPIPPLQSHESEDDAIAEPLKAFPSPKFEGKRKEAPEDPFESKEEWEDPSASQGGFTDQFSGDSGVFDEEASQNKQERSELGEVSSAMMRQLVIRPSREITGTFDLGKGETSSGTALPLNEARYLGSYQNTRGTRVWNFAYLDDAPIFSDTPSLYDSDWFFIRWLRRFMHCLQPTNTLVHQPQSIEAVIRSSKVLPLPILKEAARFISFVTPDGHVANYKNMALKMADESSIFPKLKVIVHLYTNRTGSLDSDKESPFTFERSVLGKKVQVSPANPFQGIDWRYGTSKSIDQTKWMRLLLKAARQLYVMLLLDAVTYSEYKHELYSFLWENIDEDGVTEIPSLPQCVCSMLYASPFESAKENISFVLDDSIPLSFTDKADILPSVNAPNRNAQVSGLSKEYYSITIQLADIMSRIQKKVDRHYPRSHETENNAVIAHFFSSLGRLVPSTTETILDRMKADAEDFHRRKAEFVQENAVSLDSSILPAARFQNAFPMIHYAFDDEIPQALDVGEEGVASLRSRDFGPHTFCGAHFFPQKSISRHHLMEDDNSDEFFFSERLNTPAALKLSAPLGSSHASIHLDIICPCVRSHGESSSLHSALLETDSADISPAGTPLDDELTRVLSIGKSVGTNEHAVFGNNCYAVWDPVTTQSLKGDGASSVGKSKFWTLSLKDRSMILPAVEKQVRLDGWRWGNETRVDAKRGAVPSTDRTYDFIVDLFHAISTQSLEGHEDQEESYSNSSAGEKRMRRTVPFTLDSPFVTNGRWETFANSTLKNKRILNLGQILPCVSQCSSGLYQTSDAHFVAEGDMCKVGLFTEMEKRWSIGRGTRKTRDATTRFHAIRSMEEPKPSAMRAFSLHDHKSMQTASFHDPFDAITLLNADTLEQLDMPSEFSLLLAEQLQYAAGTPQGAAASIDPSKDTKYRKKLTRWFEELRDAKHKDLPDFIKKILPHAEVIPDPLSPFKKNVICVPPSLNFHWDLQRSESVVDRDTIYAKSMAQFYKGMHQDTSGHRWTNRDDRADIDENDWTKSIHRHFRHEVRRNHFLFSHHNAGRVFAEGGQRNQSSAQYASDWALPVIPKDPFVQSVLPYPETISGKHDLSEAFHPFTFPRGAKHIARNLLLSDGHDRDTTDPTLMESVASPMLLLSFLKHISTVTLGTYFYDLLHPDLPCTSIVFSESRDEGNLQESSGAPFTPPAFLNELPTKNDIFVTVDGDAPATMLVPSHARDSKRISGAVSEEYASLFTRQMDFLFAKWNAIRRSWEEKNAESNEHTAAFDPPLFLDFPGHSWVLSEDYKSSTIMPLLQEVAVPPTQGEPSDAPKGMALVNVFCPCEPLRDSAWTVLSSSCVRFYRSADSACLYAQNPETKEYFAVNADDNSTVEFPAGSPVVNDRYFGFMPGAFSTKFAFSGAAKNQTSHNDRFERYDPFDGKVISVSSDRVRTQSPMPCASVCEPLNFGRSVLGGKASADRGGLYYSLFTRNYCHAGVAVNNRD